MMIDEYCYLHPKLKFVAQQKTKRKSKNIIASQINISDQTLPPLSYSNTCSNNQ